MSQAAALLVDASRELRSRSLFWVSLSLSAIVAVSLFGLVGFDETGWRVLWFTPNESDVIRAGTPGARRLMMLFFSMFVRFWLCWGAIILAIVSTASILPGFLADGAVELALAKPISRIRLFFMKIVGALLFVLVQSSITVLIAYFLLGIRGGIWTPAMLWAIPLIVVQFLYIYAVSVLVAVVTRSTLASLLVSCVFWGIVSLSQFVSNQMDSMIAQYDSMIAPQRERIAEVRRRAEAEGRELTPGEEMRVTATEAEIQPLQKQLDMMRPFRGPANTIELIVPKTGDIQKIIANVTDAPTLSELTQTMANDFRPQGFDEDEWQDMQTAGRAGDRAVREVNRWQSLSTSLAFTSVVLALACFLFSRRDF